MTLLTFRDCEFVKKQTSVLGETTLLQFGGSIDGQPNPLEIDLGLNDFKVQKRNRHFLMYFTADNFIP